MPSAAANSRSGVRHSAANAKVAIAASSVVMPLRSGMMRAHQEERYRGRGEQRNHNLGLAGCPATAPSSAIIRKSREPGPRRFSFLRFTGAAHQKANRQRQRKTDDGGVWVERI